MATLEAFLHTIAADPSNAAVTWLVLADWLEEQNDPRGELVRLLYQPDYEHARTPEQRNARLRELLDSVPPLFENTLNAHFVWVPPGTFWMGGGGGKPGEQQRRIKPGFALGAFPVTQAQWQVVMGNNPSYFSRTGAGRNKVKDISDADLWQFPVETVSWEDVQKFIEKLNEKERARGSLYRLPTEAEWEYACRGRAISKEESSYHFYFASPTNELSSKEANFNGNYPVGEAEQGPFLKRPTKVGSYAPNHLGLYDMHGNVSEWCADLHDPRTSARIFRGGGWGSNGQNCRASSRGYFTPSGRCGDHGFRLVRKPVR